jgi:antitoxin (DNA-binding transcriptional repressor) of toxin-antitoxin stability system
VEAGEEIVIARNGKAIARLVPEAPKRPRRRLGWAKGKIIVAPDAFDPMTDEELDAIYNSPDEALNRPWSGGVGQTD